MLFVGKNHKVVVFVIGHQNTHVKFSVKYEAKWKGNFMMVIMRSMNLIGIQSWMYAFFFGLSPKIIRCWQVVCYIYFVFYSKIDR